MTTQSLTINNQSGQQLYCYVVSPGFTVQSTTTLASGLNTIQLSQSPQMRIYFSSSSNLFSPAGEEPIGWNTTSPFSFYEYTIDGSGFSADMSYINDWAYPVQTTIKDSTGTGHNFGFLNATEIAMTLAAMKPGTFVTSAASGKGVGTTSDLYDAANQRFAGPMRLWQQQAIMANAVQAGQTAYWPPNPPAGWLSFLKDVPYGPSPFGYPVSGKASSLNAKKNYPAYGFDFSVDTNWTAMNGGSGATVQEPSGEQFFADNWNVWNYGFTTADPSTAKPNPNYSFENNAYTQTLRAQASSEGAAGTLPDTAGTSPSAGNPNFVGFYTASKDDYYATFTVPDLSNVTLTVGALAPTTIGSSSNDIITGTSGDDTISGGYGADILTGAPPRSSASGGLSTAMCQPGQVGQVGQVGQAGSPNASLQKRGPLAPIGGGSDTYVYMQADSSLHGAKTRDTITDFGLDDRIDLSRVDANTRKKESQSFNWIKTRSFTGKAGQLRIDYGSFFQPHPLLQGDIDGNGRPDFEVMLLGVKSFTAANLILA